MKYFERYRKDGKKEITIDLSEDPEFIAYINSISWSLKRTCLIALIALLLSPLIVLLFFLIVGKL